MNQNQTFSSAVYSAVKKIPSGKVATYGQIAEMIGKPNASRAVGSALHHNQFEGIVPCHRVVNRNGRLAPNFAFDGPMEQKIRLEAEGVEVTEKDGKFFVDLAKFGL